MYSIWWSFLSMEVVRIWRCNERTVFGTLNPCLIIHRRLGSGSQRVFWPQNSCLASFLIMLRTKLCPERPHGCSRTSQELPRNLLFWTSAKLRKPTAPEHVPGWRIAFEFSLAFSFFPFMCSTFPSAIPIVFSLHLYTNFWIVVGDNERIEPANKYNFRAARCYSTSVLIPSRYFQFYLLVPIKNSWAPWKSSNFCPLTWFCFELYTKIINAYPFHVLCCFFISFTL